LADYYEEAVRGSQGNEDTVCGCGFEGKSDIVFLVFTIIIGGEMVGGFVAGLKFFILEVIGIRAVCQLSNFGAFSQINIEDWCLF